MNTDLPSGASAPTDPMSLLGSWLTTATAAGVPAPATVVLATADTRGRPSTRTIGLHGCDERGLLFFINLGSRKGRDLAENPHAAATFFWPQTMQQVNMAGVVEPLTDVESDRMWASRGQAGQAVSLASAQGEMLADEAELTARAAAMAASDTPLIRPAQHAGLLLKPRTVEFWDGRPDRLHWRTHYERTPSGWVQWRLQP